MKQEVRVSIRSEQTDPDGHREIVEARTKGVFLNKDGKGYLSYQEAQDEAPPGKVTLKMDGESLLMLRHGDLPARLFFQKDERHPGVYHTPYGVLRMVTHTHALSFTADPSGEIQIEYTLLLEDDPVMHTKLEVCWEER